MDGANGTRARLIPDDRSLGRLLDDEADADGGDEGAEVQEAIGASLIRAGSDFGSPHCGRLTRQPHSPKADIPEVGSGSQPLFRLIWTGNWALASAAHLQSDPPYLTSTL